MGGLISSKQVFNNIKPYNIDIERLSYTDDEIPKIKNITEEELWQILKT